jgi:uncharacterized protein (TIGR03437 family)
MAVDSAGNLYIADIGANVVWKLIGGALTVFAGTGDDALYSTSGPATTLPLSTPGAIAFDGAGNLYAVSEDAATLVKITPGGTMSIFAGDGYEMTSDGDGGLATAAHFYDPAGIATDAIGNVYVADVTAQVIRKINTGGIISTIAGKPRVLGYSGDGGPSGAATFFNPTGLAVDKSGSVLVADTFNNRVRKVDPVALIISSVAGSSVPLGDGGPATASQLLEPTATALDPAGNLYIADQVNNRIRKIDTTGKISTFAGTGTPGYSGDGGPAVSAQLLLPYAVGADANGNIFISDRGNSRIRKVAPNGTINTIAGNGIFGFSGDGGSAVQAELAGPQCVRPDTAGNLYIADTDNNRIRKINSSGIITTVAGGNSTTYGDGGVATAAQLLGPSCVAIDSNKDLYIADTNHNTIRKVDATGIISTVAGTTGNGDAFGEGVPATAASLNQPYDAIPDSNGNLFIADTQDAVIRKVSSNGIISKVAGSYDFFGVTGDGGLGFANYGQIGGITGISLDTAGNLYLADSYNNLIRKLVGPTGPADFTFSPGQLTSSLTTTVAAGSTATIYLSVNVNNNFSGNIVFSVTGLTTGSVVFPSSPFLFFPGQTAIVSALITIPPTAPAATLNLTFAATCDTLTHTVNETLVILPAGPPAPLISAAGVVNAASFAGGAVAPGEIVTIYGANFGPASIATLQLNSTGKVASTLSGTTATFNGLPAPIIYAVAGQMSVVVPYEVAGSSSAALQVTYNGIASNAVTVPITDASPALFTYNASGTGPLAAANQDGSVNTAANPAAVGSVMVFYGTGEGQTSPAGVDGQVSASVYPKPVLPVSATIGGLPATVLYYGAAPGDVAGAFQLNVMIPSGVPTGPSVPVTFTVGTKTSKPGVTIAVH